MPESAKIAEPEADDPTPISGEWLAIGVAIRAHIQSIPKRRQKAFVEGMDKMFAALEASLAATPIKRSARGRARLEAAHAAVAWYRSARPFLLA